MAFTAVVVVYGLVEKRRAAKKEAKAQTRLEKAQRDERKEQKKLADIKANRENKRLAREARIARSKIAVASGGQTGSSLVQGATGSIQTQVASAAGFQGQQVAIADNIFAAGGRASAASSDIAGAQRQGQEAQALVSTASIFA